ncbi:MAG: toll/interleukin-1 receptor domain-containing protein [Hyphomonadaceae bacterium]|nr:toll/interleukin-1 receptor domain-containing protein [Hyphomonadaceae bacterium]
MATNVFISYRRDDTRDFTGRIVDRLKQAPEIGQVFLDVEGIDPGADFGNKIEAALKQSEFCLIVIGPGWVGRSDQGPRIKQDGDWVRKEVARALASTDAKVLPVLATGASMPDDADLPEELRPLTRLNAVSVRHESFERDVDYLIDVILKRKKPGSFQLYLSRHPLQAGVLRGATGFVLAAVAVLLLAVAHGIVTGGRALNQTLGGTGPMLVAVIAVLAVGTVLPLLPKKRRRAA